MHCSTWPTPAHRLLLRGLIQNTETQHQSQLLSQLLWPAISHRPYAAVASSTSILFSFVTADTNSVITQDSQRFHFLDLLCFPAWCCKLSLAYIWSVLSVRYSCCKNNLTLAFIWQFAVLPWWGNKDRERWGLTCSKSQARHEPVMLWFMAGAKASREHQRKSLVYNISYFCNIDTIFSGVLHWCCIYNSTAWRMSAVLKWPHRNSVRYHAFESMSFPSPLPSAVTHSQPPVFTVLAGELLAAKSLLVLDGRDLAYWHAKWGRVVSLKVETRW